MFVDQHLHIETFFFLCSAGYDLLLRGRRHLCPQIQQSFTERLGGKRGNREMEVIIMMNNTMSAVVRPLSDSSVSATFIHISHVSQPAIQRREQDSFQIRMPVHDTANTERERFICMMDLQLCVHLACTSLEGDETDRLKGNMPKNRTACPHSHRN